MLANNSLFIIEGQVVPLTRKKSKQLLFENILHKNLAEIKKLENARGRFILATNDFNLERLPDHLILKEYKEQSKTERKSSERHVPLI